ncbi:MAG: winged helix-turn-helix domain-containing protein [Bacteroidota bacterium]
MPDYAFGPFRLEPSERRLWRDGALVEIEPKAFDVLVVLAEQAGHLVTKDALMAAVWPDAVVEDNALTVQVSKLRSALGESARAWRYVETVPKQGYRFAPVARIDRPPASETPASAPTASEAVRPRPEAGRRRAPALRAGLLAVGVGAVALAALGIPRATSEATPARPPMPAASETDRPAAQAAYDRGRAVWWTRRDFEDALWDIRTAAVLDASFALAHVAEADIHAMGYQTADEARASLDRAFALDPDLGEAHATLGLIRMLQDWDWTGAGEALEQARALAPGYTPAHQWTATLRMVQGDPEAALAALDRALDVAPLEARPVLFADRCQALYLARRFDAAAAACGQALDADPQNPFAGRYGFWSLALDGRAGDAVRWVQERNGGPRHLLSTAAPEAFEGPAGRDHLAEHLAQQMHAPDHARILDSEAVLAGFVGDTERALAAFEQAVEVRHFHAPFLAVDPIFDDLRDDPRFQAAVRAVGLEPR